MVTKITIDPLISNKATDALKKFGKLRLVPSLAVDVTAEGGSFVWVQVGWTTHLAAASLKVVLESGSREDITAQLIIDPGAMTATGSVDTRSCGIQMVRAEGEFLAQLAPVRSVRLSASGSAYLPY